MVGLPGRQRFWSGDRGVARALGILTVALLVVTSRDIGLTWDEPAYIAASESYVQWLDQLVLQPEQALSDGAIKHYWEPNHEHPPLDKVWSGLVWVVARFVFDDLTAHRLGNILLAGMLVGLLYLMVAREYGRVAGLGAAAALLTMPRFFFHAHLAALDVPVAVMGFVVVFLFWHTRERRGLQWSLWLGLAWGAAVATKINALVVLPTLMLWMLLFQRRLYLFGRIVLAGVIGIPFSLLLWPWLYDESQRRLVDYLRFITVDHWEIGQWYLGRFYMPPPWHFPFVMAFAVVPLTLTVLAVLGIVRAIKQWRREPLGWLFVFSALVPMLALTTGRTMVYDNERLFMPAFPYLAALAGLGFDWLVQRVRRLTWSLTRPGWARLVPLVVAGIAFLPHSAFAYSLYPHLLSYYSESIGGLPGGARLGLEYTYWCETYKQALPYLNRHAPPGAVVWVEEWSHDVMLYYQLHGRLRRDLRIAAPAGAPSVLSRHGMQPYGASIRDADYVVVQHRQTGFTDAVRNWLQGRSPVYRLSYQGVPLIEIYTRDAQLAAGSRVE